MVFSDTAVIVNTTSWIQSHSTLEAISLPPRSLYGFRFKARWLRPTAYLHNDIATTSKVWKSHRDFQTMSLKVCLLIGSDPLPSWSSRVRFRAQTCQIGSHWNFAPRQSFLAVYRAAVRQMRHPTVALDAFDRNCSGGIHDIVSGPSHRRIKRSRDDRYLLGEYSRYLTILQSNLDTFRQPQIRISRIPATTRQVPGNADSSNPDCAISDSCSSRILRRRTINPG
jgi:hypothetical protein